jgi:glucokinase
MSGAPASDATRSAAPYPRSRRGIHSERADWVVGADIGGTKIVAGAVAPDGGIRGRRRRPVPAGSDPEAVLELLASMVAEVAAEAPTPPRAVGVGVAGQVEPETGVVVFAPNLRWREFPLGPRLSQRVGRPVRVRNDAHAIALGESAFGAGAGARNLLTVCVGTGLGGGFIVDGRLLEGEHHAAGEIGHLTLVAGGRACHCPSRGCFEAYVSGWAIAERLREAARESPGRLRALVESAGGIEALTARHLSDAAERGDPFSRSFRDVVAEEFASGIVGLVNAFNPDRVVLGGAVVQGMPQFGAAAQEAVRRRCQPPAAGANVVQSRLGADAGVLGGAVLARQALRRGGRRR